ncbi:MAG TPA: hypothetical protein VFS00_18830, partial [Polyangiaceae bacterium]|nr:hypothetical protein [Polyangiaceae bacterium]
SVLPPEGDGSLAKRALAAREQIRAVTGVDVADIARRLGAGAPAARPINVDVVMPPPEDGLARRPAAPPAAPEPRKPARPAR